MRSLADLLVKPVLFQFGGETWRLLITYGVLLDCESESDADMLGSTEGIVSPSAQVLRALLWAALRRAGARWSIEEVGAMIKELRQIAGIRRALQQAFIASLPPAKKKKRKRSEDPEPKPTWPKERAEAREDLGLSDKEWLAMTMREAHEIREARIRHRLQPEELFFSRLTTAVMNFSGRLEKPLKQDHYMVHPFPKKEESIGDLIAAQFEALEKL